MIQSGLDHLASAKVLFEAHFRFYDSAGYLSHLGMELLFKSVLLHAADQFPDSHSLRDLLATITERGRPFSLDESDGETIDLLDHFKELRYPNPADPIDIGDEDWPLILKLAEKVIEQLPAELQAHCAEVNSTTKGGRILMMKPKKDVS